MIQRKMARILKWGVVIFLILTLLLLNTFLIQYYRNHKHEERGSPKQSSVKDNSLGVGIPKIIHVMWSERLVPNSRLEYVGRWTEHNPDHKVWFWTDRDFEQLLRSHYGAYQNAYNELKNHDKIVSRRYFIIHRYGGVFADLDMESLKPLTPLLRNHSCLLSQEPEIHAKLGWRIDKMIGSAFIACRPNHPFFQLILNLLQANGRDPHKLAATGSVMLSRVYARYHDLTQEMDHPSGRLDVAQPDTFMPLICSSYLDALRKDCPKQHASKDLRKPFCDKYGPLGYKNNKIPPESYAVHHWYRGWTRNSDEDQRSTTNKRDIYEVITNVQKPTIV